MDLDDFVLARIAEDEGIIEAAGVNEPYLSRLLAGCHAKRRIVEDCKDYLLHDPYGMAGELATRTLLGLAFPYATHPDYPEEPES